LVFKCGGNVDSDGTFADTSLATAYCDDFFNLGQVFLFGELFLFSLGCEIDVNIRESIFFQILFDKAFKSSVILRKVEHE